jgi:hypothetical protein
MQSRLPWPTLDYKTCSIPPKSKVTPRKRAVSNPLEKETKHAKY